MSSNIGIQKLSPENFDIVIGNRERTVLDAMIQYAFRPGTENFWDEGEEIKAPLIDVSDI